MCVVVVPYARALSGGRRSLSLCAAAALSPALSMHVCNKKKALKGHTYALPTHKNKPMMMMTTTTTTTTTNTTTNDNTNTNTNADATAQPPQPQQLPPRERRPKWMRAPTPFEKQRGARLILEAAGLLRPCRRVLVAAVADGSSTSSVGGAAAVVAVAVAAAAEGAEEEEEESAAAWRAMMALHQRLRAQSVVAATRRLFPAFVALAMRQDPGTMAADGVKYEMSALPDAFVLAQHPHCFLVARKEEGEATEEQQKEEEAQKNNIALMVDAGAALAETFEVLLNEFRLRPRRRYDARMMTPATDAVVGGERISRLCCSSSAPTRTPSSRRWRRRRRRPRLAPPLPPPSETRGGVAAASSAAVVVADA
jgi:hypothetical protein